MGCSWVTVEGKRQRVGPAERVRLSTVVHELDVKQRLNVLGLVYASGSARFSIDELKNATIRVWKDPETGYMAEARFTPSSPPIYHHIDEDQARLVEAGKASPAFIAHMFTADEPVVY